MVVKTNQFNVNLHEAIAVGDVMSCEKLIKLPGVDINGKFVSSAFFSLPKYTLST